MPGTGRASVTSLKIDDAMVKTLNDSKVLKEKNIDSKENILANKRRERSSSRAGTKDMRGKLEEIDRDRSSAKKDKASLLEMKEKMDIMSKERDFYFEKLRNIEL